MFQARLATNLPVVPVHERLARGRLSAALADAKHGGNVSVFFLIHFICLKILSADTPRGNNSPVSGACVQRTDRHLVASR